MKHENSLGVILTETWLTSDINDAEVNIDGYTIYRSDRKVRMRGGAAIYLRNDLNGKLESSYSNTVVEYVIVKVKKLDTLFISIYRPPDTSNNEWSLAIKSLNDDINMC